MLRRTIYIMVLVACFLNPTLSLAKRDFMTTSVTVTNYTSEALKQSLTQALSRVLVKISGNPSVMTLPQVQNELTHINHLVAAYSYQSTADASGKPQLNLQVAFNDHAIKRLLSSAGQPIWNADRPATVVWLQVNHQSGDRNRVSADSLSESPLASALDRDAKSRGLRLLFPMQDLDDQAAFGGDDHEPLLNVTELQQASKRYHVVSMLSGYAKEVGGHWQADWLYVFDGAPIRWQDEADSVEQLAQRAVNNVAGTMISQLAMASPEQSESSVLLHVAGVDDLGQYAMVQEYLQALSPVTKVSLETVDANQMVVRVRFQGTLHELQRAINASHRMDPSPSDWLQQQDSPTLAYRWLGGVG